ncbi:MAG TPA: nuclear transport factor 2 family protein [Puia sp.]|nr:nuclear transport factor 2 family protein [Puia sp.]
MSMALTNKLFCSSLAIALLGSCIRETKQKTAGLDSNEIIEEVKKASHAITHYAAKADFDSLLACYADIPDFLAISNDGVARKFPEYKAICKSFYSAANGQELTTIQERFHVVDKNLVILTWTGNINALFKNGETWIMKNYTVTSVFQKIGDKWKVIHVHESSLPPEVKK